MVFVFLFALMFLPNIVIAKEEPLVVINEIAWMGSFVNGVNANQHWRHEWLELFSSKDSAISLEGWSVELYRNDELYFQIPMQGIISGNGYFLLGASDKIPSVDMNYANLGGKFLNTGMRVVVKDALGNTIDEVDARGGWPVGDKESKQTMERKILDASVEWQTSLESGGTPGMQNSEGLEQLLSSVNPVQQQVVYGVNKKDLTRPLFTKFSELSFTPFLLALPLSLGFGFLILVLRRVLSRQS